MVSQIERDLDRLAGERLDKWIKDTFTIHEIAELGPRTAAMCIVTHLIKAIAAMMATTDAPSAELGRLFGQVMEAAQKMKQKQHSKGDHNVHVSGSGRR